MKKILFFLFFYFLTFSLFPHSVFAQQPWTERCAQDVCLVDEDPCPPDKIVKKVATIQGFECIIRIILNLAVRLAGIAVFIMLIIGGFKYLTSGGDPKATESARNTITYAIFGLAILIGSWFILLLIKEFTGIDVTIFEILGP